MASPTLFRSDHYMNLDGQHAERGSLDAWGTLCALAASTTTLRLGTMVSPAPFRHPSELAKLVVTADHVSAGRSPRHCSPRRRRAGSSALIGESLAPAVA